TGYITKNEHVRSGISIETIIWAFRATEESNWHPLTWISHLLDCTLFGLDPVYHHAMNLLLHLLSSIFLFIVMHKATHALWQSAFVALIFAIHPLHVESVAWAAERKDVLSGLFWMLTLWSYLKYRQSPSNGRYIATLCLFTLGLLAKPMLVTLPFVLILLDYWQLNYFPNQNKVTKKEKITERAFLIKSIREKIPFFILSIASSIITYLVQRHGGSMAGAESLSFSIRLENAIFSYVKYIWKTLVPNDLTIFYPHPESSLEFWQVGGAALLIIIITIFVWHQRTKHRYLIIGWFWFIGTLVPVIGLVQVGLQSMADRYMYLPIIGLSIMVAWGFPILINRLPVKRLIIIMIFIISMIAMVMGTRSQVGKWSDSFTLFEHSLAVDSNNFVAYTNLGVVLADSGRYTEAISHLREASRIKPNDILIRGNIAHALLAEGEFREALAHYKWVLTRVPTDPSFHNRAADLLAYEGKIEEAIKHYLEAIRIDSTDPNTYCSLGKLYAEQGRYDIAKQKCLMALKIKPRFYKAHNFLGIIAAKQNLFDEASNEFSEAIRIDSTNADAYNDFGILYERMGKDAEAVEMYETAVRVNPSHVNATFNLGTMFTKQGKLDEAEIHWKKVVEFNPKSTDTRMNLGRLYTIQGRTDDAIQQLVEVLNLDSNNVVAHYNLGNLYSKASRLSEAEVHYKEAIRIEPTFQAAEDSLKRLRNRTNR
ncbi:MAG: tetratricopeptide repeat protein, partial [Bacteroidota bacterium]|nr:tetratricopeptide repeat protein [Bacteroidota bacterium]